MARRRLRSHRNTPSRSNHGFIRPVSRTPRRLPERTMTTRLVLADQAEARFYDVDAIGGSLHRVGQMSDPKAHLHDRDLKSDRPGRVFDHAFAGRIVHELDAARVAHEFDRLVLIAGP